MSEPITNPLDVPPNPGEPYQPRSGQRGSGFLTGATEACTMSTKASLILSASGPHGRPMKLSAARSSVSFLIAG